MIQRWNVGYEGAMVESGTGEVVYYDDHVAALAARDELLRELADYICELPCEEPICHSCRLYKKILALIGSEQKGGGE